uniref:Stage 0 sporulation protein n=1 Tax=uncultured Bacillota bacterium TaxID=344338 RepID=A0A650F538_9FIRM|nr:stage 0 sporulation protein [uncultured Firmicutes bacterium]
MTEIIGIRFSPAGKIYYFSPQGHSLRIGDKVIVETSRGVELGTVSIQNRNIPDEEIQEPLKPILRLAEEKDFEQLKRNKEKEREAFTVANEEIARHGLDMKLIRVEYTFDGSKILFYFTADGRVDFRELVKSLAGIFRTRIELRQIGVRDEAKHLGALGICGRFLCCSSYLNDFQPVSIKMAKEQGLSLNPTKISGVCGRLMCCLQYEQEAYEAALKEVPRVGTTVSTDDGTGVVTETNVLKRTMKVRIEKPEGTTFGQYTVDEVTVLRGGKGQKAEDSSKSDTQTEAQKPEKQTQSDENNNDKSAKQKKTSEI